MDLQEYIKQLVQQELDEMSVSSGAGGYLSPNAFAKKGQKTNAATAQAMRSGFTKASGMPKKSKVLDYKELWKGKKSAMNNESNYDKPSQKGAPSGYTAASPYTAASGYTASSDYDKNESMNEIGTDEVVATLNNPNLAPDVKKTLFSAYKQGHITANGVLAIVNLVLKKNTTSSEMNETLLNIIKQELLNEVTYNKFKKDVKHRTKSEQLHKAIREVKRKLQEIDRIVEYTSRMKQELSEEGGVNYWKATQKNVATISEMVNQLNNKIKNLNQ
jgi:hypothetical protein